MTTEATGTEAEASGQPETATDRTGTTAGAAETPQGNAPASQPGLDSLPGELRETLSAIPPEQWPAHVKVYKSMQSQKDRAIQQAKDSERRLEALARNGETLERIAKHPKAKELLWEAGRLASQEPGADAEDTTAEYEKLLADADPKNFGKTLDAIIEKRASRLVDQKLEQRDATTRQADDALTSAFAAVREGVGVRLTDDQWASVAEKAWKEHGGRAGFTPDNVASQMLPHVLDAIETLRGKPAVPARAAKAASLMGQTGSVQPAVDDKPWLAQKRAPTRAEGIAYMMKRAGTPSPKDFMAAWHGTTRS